MALKNINNDEGTIQGLTLLILTLIFGCAAYMWMTLPITNGVATSVTLFWAASPSVPDAAYEAGFQNLADLLSGKTIAFIVMLIAGISFLIVALRSKFTVN